MDKLLEEIMHNRDIMGMLENVINNQSSLTEMSAYAYEGELGKHNLAKGKLFFNYIGRYIRLFNNNGLNEYISQLCECFLQDDTIETIVKQNDQILYDRVLKHLDIPDDEIETIESHEKIESFLNTKLLENNLVFIMDESLFNKSKINSDLLFQINQILQKRGLQTVGISEQEGVYRFYNSEEQEIKQGLEYTFDLGDAYFDSRNMPRLLSSLCAISANMNGTQYDNEAFARKDKVACINNMNMFFDENNFTDDERKLYLMFFEETWQLYNMDDNKYERLICIENPQLDTIGKTNLSKFKSSFEIFNTLVKRDGSSISLEDFLRENAETVDVNSVELRTNGEDNQRKYVRLRNNEKIYPSILINADKWDMDVLCIGESKSAISVSHLRSGTNTIVDVFNVPSDLGKNDTLENGSVPFQSIAMMLAVNGIGIDDKGKAILDNLRSQYNIEEVSQYYLGASKLLLNLVKSDRLSPNKRTKLADRALSDLIPKAIYMSKYGKYPENHEFMEEECETSIRGYRQLSVMRGSDSIDETKFEAIVNDALGVVEGRIDEKVATRMVKKEFGHLGTYKKFEKEFSSILGKDFVKKFMKEQADYIDYIPEIE